MVLERRLDYDFNGHQVQVKRRARSARRRAKFQRRVEDNQMCAFDLLATVAGKLFLQEKEHPLTSGDKSSEKIQQGFVKEECRDASEPFEAELSNEGCHRRCEHGFVKDDSKNADKPFKAELYVEGSSDIKCLSNTEVQSENCHFKELSHPKIDGNSHVASMVANSSCLERLGAERLADEKNHNEVENLISKVELGLSSKVELGSSGSPDTIGCNLGGDVSKVKDELHKFAKAPVVTSTEMRCLDDPVGEKSPVQLSSGGNAKLSGCVDNMPYSTLSEGYDNVPVVSRDDDENFSGCDNPSFETKSFRPISHIGDQSIRKTLAAKYCKVAQQSKHDTLSNSGEFMLIYVITCFLVSHAVCSCSLICFSIGNILVEVMNGNLNETYTSRKNFYKRQRSEMNIPFKKRKIFNCGSFSNSNELVRSGGTYDKKNGASSTSHGTHKDTGMSSLGTHQYSSLGSKDSHVNLRIKSFRVPELFIEIPETATIESLKRSVMEAVTAVLGGGLRVGVILHGKKVRDDSKTLLQAGISHDKQLDALGFTLEPISSQSPTPLCAADSRHVPTVDKPQPLPRYPSSAAIHQRNQSCSDVLPEHRVTSLGNLVESDQDSALSPVNTAVYKRLADSRALVTVPEMGVQALSLLPVPQKSKRPETVQRRIRRPFSVAEVEALVQAVEKLGTGRWRDVKLRAFDNAKHRTYVDLKDKWKTLVHTARISPQQRRGEPVPQELLDRVLTAHAFWSQHQTKQQLNKQHQQQQHQQQPQTCLLLQ
ncbi:telomere repeat-binding protein 5 isoform X1 [Arachis hypogaea]|uniref:telomere repeat-binding protein 5 isoform X1 n=1 Tax=Arachis hypogaea TaxID=3818 RepID=UPI000DEDD5E1|nr:telomere repeat-binding protein 5 isoform X1 [Arachis hypogaea]XP_025673776.1 telomere repeat-binding protein 5 isoform X1 [Arachis hypogaea]QHN94991.1 Telomere repeat-binding protein [Arachis hypogaea]